MKENVYIKIYQVDPELDEYQIRFADSSKMKQYYFEKPTLLKIYEKVYQGEFPLYDDDFSSMFGEILYQIQNGYLKNFKGLDLNISDIIVVDDIHYFYIDSDGVVEI